MNEYELEIDSVRANVNNAQRIVFLKQKDSNRYMPIWIGPNEADAIVYKLNNIEAPRPLTHDLLDSAISALGGKVERIVVNRLHQETFYATIEMRLGEKLIELDARPSDAIALSVRTCAPIYASDDVMEKAGVLMDKDEDEEADNDEEKDSASGDKLPFGKMERGGPLGKEERRNLSAFAEFIESLDIDNLDETKGS